MKQTKSPPVPLRTDDLNIPHGNRKTMASLQTSDCRWPFGDPVELDFHFCGKSKVGDGPYCDFHMRRAFQAARPRTIGYWPNVA
jgi:GcrA cell cycle regulator